MLSLSDFKEHQKHALKFLMHTGNCALWMDMGLGKTATVLTAVNILQQHFAISRVLVVAPKRVARKVWKDEAAKWEHLQHMRVVTMHGDAKQREKALHTMGEVHTISFDNLQWLTDHYRKKGETAIRKSNPWPFDMIVIDEASGFKNRETNRWKAMFRVFRAADRIVELTGSPAPNGLIDVWAPIYFLDQGRRLGTSLTDFRGRWFEKPEYSYRWVPLDHAQDEINVRLKGICLSMRAEDYLDLPPIMHNRIEVEMSPSQKKQYDEMARKYYIDLGGKRILAANAGVLFGKTLQLANGACYFDDERNFETFHEQKIEALNELLTSSMNEGKPVMLFYSYWHDLIRIKSLMKRMKVKRFRVLDTEQDEDDWNAGKLDVLAMHPASGGHGLNLQEGGETICWFGQNPSLELYNQANARLAGGLRRVGKNIIIHSIITQGTADEDVEGILEWKGDTEDALFEAVKARFH